MNSTPISKKPARIKSIFASVAPKYDLANSLLSGGIHRLWKKQLVKRVGALLSEQPFNKQSTVNQSLKVLDTATGTGDVAFEWMKFSPEAQVTGLDFSPEMLAQAKSKNTVGVEFVEGDILNLPFVDSSFDALTLAFGIRNVENVPRALDEIFRVLKPGAALGILEFGAMEKSLFNAPYRFYQTKVLPVVGGMITGDAKAYQYLENSSNNFPSKEKFIALLESAGFQNCHYENKTGGIAYLYLACKA